MDRRRRRLSDATPSPAGRASVTCGSHGPTQPAATAWADQQRGLLCSPLLGCIERSTRGAQIPIALMAPSRPTDRGFLPWRVSDDGPGASRVVAMGRHPKPFTRTDMDVLRTQRGRSPLIRCRNLGAETPRLGCRRPGARGVLRAVGIVSGEHRTSSTVRRRSLRGLLEALVLLKQIGDVAADEVAVEGGLVEVHGDTLGEVLAMANSSTGRSRQKSV